MEGEGVRTKVIRKRTVIERYLDFRSAHYKSIKWGVVSCLKSRAERICSSPKELQEDMEYLRRVFTRNGYPDKEVRRRLAGVEGWRMRREEDRKISLLACQKWRAPLIKRVNRPERLSSSSQILRMFVTNEFF